MCPVGVDKLCINTQASGDGPEILLICVNEEQELDTQVIQTCARARQTATDETESSPALLSAQAPLRGAAASPQASLSQRHPVRLHWLVSVN